MSHKNYQKKSPKRMEKGGSPESLDNGSIRSAAPTNEMTTPETNAASTPSQNEFYGLFSGIWNSKNFAIILLFILLVLSFLGINILLILGAFFQWLIGVIGPFISKILSYIGYAIGSIINKTADLVSGTAKTTIDIADGTVHSVGNLLRNGSNADVDVSSRIQLDNISYDLLPSTTSLPTSPPPSLNESWSFNSFFSSTTYNSLDDVLNTDTQSPSSLPSPDTTNAAIQASLTGNKQGWCLTGEYNGSRACVEVGAQDKCMSGQVYPSEAKCLNVKPPTVYMNEESSVKESSEVVVQNNGGNVLPVPPGVPPRPFIPNPPVYNGVPPFPPNTIVPPIPIAPNPNVMPNGFAPGPIPGLPRPMPAGPIPPPPPLHGPPMPPPPGSLPLPPVPGRIPTMDGPPIVAGPPNYLTISTTST
jgi:hypothetical protein